MAATRRDLFDYLEQLGIATKTVDHAPVFTVDEAKSVRDDLPGGHCKSLFLKDKKDKLWLFVCLEDRRVDMKKLQKLLGSARLSFGKPELLQEVLGLTPGSVTPFGLINDRNRQVEVALEREMLSEDPLHYHPLQNDATTAIAAEDLLKFVRACGREPLVISLAEV